MVSPEFQKLIDQYEAKSSAPSQDSALREKRADTFAKLPNWLMERSDIESGCKITYARIAQYANGVGYCYASHETLAKGCGCSVSTIKRRIEVLVEMKLINKMRRGKNQSNIYVIS